MSLLKDKDIEAIRLSFKTRRDIEDVEYAQISLKIWEKFNGYRKSGEFCDVEIRCRDGVLHSHKCILSSSCPYFETLLTSPLSSTEGKQIIQFDYYSLRTVNSILEYIYNYFCFELEEATNVEELLHLAEFIHLDLLITELVDSIRSTVNESNCLEWCEVSKSCGVEKGFIIARSYITQNYDSLMEGHEMLSKKIQDIVSTQDDPVLQREIALGVCYEGHEETSTFGDQLFCVINTSTRSVEDLYKLYSRHFDQNSQFKYFSFFVHDMMLMSVSVYGLSRKHSTICNQWAFLRRDAAIYLSEYDQLNCSFHDHDSADDTTLQIDADELFSDSSSHRCLASVFHDDGLKSLYLVTCEWCKGEESTTRTYKIFNTDLQSRSLNNNWIVIMPKSTNIVLAKSKTFGTILIDGLNEIYLVDKYDFRYENSSSHEAVSLNISSDRSRGSKRPKLYSPADCRPWNVVSYKDEVYLFGSSVDQLILVYVLDEVEKCWVQYCACPVPELHEIHDIFTTQGNVFISVMVSDTVAVADPSAAGGTDQYRVELHQFDVEGRSLVKIMDLPHRRAISVIPDYFLY